MFDIYSQFDRLVLWSEHGRISVAHVCSIYTVSIDAPHLRECPIGTCNATIKRSLQFCKTGLSMYHEITIARLRNLIMSVDVLYAKVGTPRGSNWTSGGKCFTNRDIVPLRPCKYGAIARRWL